MATTKVLVLGGNFGGLTAALAVHHDLDGDVDVTVVSASDRFLFSPSLITFPLAPTFDAHGVEFVHAEATALDLAGRAVETTGGRFGYDHLVIATGFRNNFDVAPGLGPDGHAHSITTLDGAVRAGEGWRRLVDDPGDIVVGATQGAGCSGAAYEYLFNASHQLRKAGLKKRARITLVASQPFLGHFGIGGHLHGERMFEMFSRGRASRPWSVPRSTTSTRVAWCSVTAPSTSSPTP
jgi:NADH dehydrogenase FAD-containing subunit